MTHRRSDDDDLAYGERWNHDRLAYERERLEERDHYFTRAPTREAPRERPRERVREASVDERFVERRAPRPWDDDHIRERRYYEEAPRRRPSPPAELERVIYHKEQEYRDSSPPRRPPGLLRRQSSLDTFDRRPAQRMYDRDHQRDEYSPPRRRDHRPDLYEPIPLPRSRGLPTPRLYAEHDYEEIKVAEPHRYGDDDFRPFPEHVMEREIVRTRKHRGRSSSRTSGAPTQYSRSRRGSSPSSSSSSSSDTGGTAITSKSEYPKKGKTRIPCRLVSIQAITMLQYPYVIEVSGIMCPTEQLVTDIT